MRKRFGKKVHHPIKFTITYHNPMVIYVRVMATMMIWVMGWDLPQEVTTIAGDGTAGVFGWDGCTSAQFNSPFSVAVQGDRTTSKPTAHCL